MLSLAGMLYTAVIKVIYRRNNWIGLLIYFFLNQTCRSYFRSKLKESFVGTCFTTLWIVSPEGRNLQLPRYFQFARME